MSSSSSHQYSHDGSKRKPKRGRWDSHSSSSVTNKTAISASGAVADEDAIVALLSSAQNRLLDKNGSKSNHRRRNGVDGNMNQAPTFEDIEQLQKNHSSASRNRDSSSNKKRRFDKNSKNNNGNDEHSWGKPSSSDHQYYGPGSDAPNQAKTSDIDNDSKNKKKELADFGLSGTLAKDTKTGNMYNGVLLKFSEPPEARTPNTRWRFYVFRGSEQVDVLHVSKQSAYLFGRESKVCDILCEHPSLSRQHCVLQYRAVSDKHDANVVRCKPYLMDLGSANGTFINGKRLEDARYYELRKKDVVTIGASTREYVLLTENTT